MRHGETAYAKYVSDTLTLPARRLPHTVIDLFAGCGGLALGFEARGFRTVGYEADVDCCVSYRTNLDTDCHNVYLNEETKYGRSDVVIGGPPCQPFSVSGNQRGSRDPRNGFPAFLRAVEQAKPKLWLMENVRGVLFRNYDYMRKQVLRPLEQMGYTITTKIVRAARHEVPQKRERFVAVGVKTGSFEFPEESPVAYTAGQALGSLARDAPHNGQYLTPSQDAYIARYEAKSSCARPRDVHLDEPARTVTCRNLGGATSDMLRVRLADGRRRRLNVREAARLQSFPDWFQFSGDQASQFRQVGNAVPPMMAYHLAGAVRKALK